MIQKNIFFIWLGNIIPKYVLLAVQAFKTANPSFKINFIHKTIHDIENCIIKNDIDRCLAISINIVLGKYAIPQHYKRYLDNQKKIYGNNVRFIQLLSDIFRIQLINSLGGIYLDCDTFPNKPFDNQLLEYDFCVSRHYNNFISQDNYFFGSKKKNNINDFLIPIPYAQTNIQKYKLICQTIPQIQTNIKFIFQKSLFYKLKLKYKQNLFNDTFYINHYCHENWKNNIYKIPICKFDKTNCKISYV